jgi:hypothetical protein
MGISHSAVANHIAYDLFPAGMILSGREIYSGLGGSELDRVVDQAEERKTSNPEGGVNVFEGLFQPMHLLMILGVALIVFGPKQASRTWQGTWRRDRSRQSSGEG